VKIGYMIFSSVVLGGSRAVGVLVAPRRPPSCTPTATGSKPKRSAPEPPA
jgi:hypothetical protein